MHTKETVFVGLSGGVDSSVSAALLKQAGYHVIGVFLRVWQADFLPCSWRDERTDAKRVCSTLGIPFLELDCADAYKKNVVDYMIGEYKAGRTPNPDVMCNATVKFGVFFDTAMNMGASLVATGHYARVEKQEGGDARLLAGVDQEKDQSYFLWRLTPAHLSRIVFPVGDKHKSDVRKLAQQFGLHTATKKDSQGLCFLGKVDMHDFLLHFVESKTGDVLDETGAVIGTHDGSVFLTIGQRHGFTITKKTPHDAPYYIVKKDIERNTITVSMHPDTRGDIARELLISTANWIETPEIGKTYSARLRYRQPLFRIAITEMREGNARVSLVDPQALVPVGQSLVVYDGDICMGGGIIDRVL